LGCLGMVISRLWDDTRCDYFLWLVGSYIPATQRKAYWGLVY
jgi:hypothetical protein